MQPVDRITIAFLDVGQGDSSVILLPDGFSAIVIDCVNATTLDYLRTKGVTNLVCVFITHSDQDHCGGVAALLQNFGRVESLAYNHDTPLISDPAKRRNVIYRHLAQAIRKGGIPTASLRAGETFSWQDVQVDVLHPADQDIKSLAPYGHTNDASGVLRVAYAGKRVLFTSDIEGCGWQWVLGRGTDLTADILKFPHHGAWFTPRRQEPSLDRILREVSPSIVVVSVGSENSFGHPHANTLSLLRSKSGLRFLCTQATRQCHSTLAGPRSCAGTVEVSIDQSGIVVAPDAASHLMVIRGFSTPQCQVSQ